jgi:hypothetical protein
MTRPRTLSRTPAAAISVPARLTDAGASFWGELPALVAIAALGLGTVAVGDTAARTGRQDLGGVLFWFGVLAIFAPGAARIAMPRTARFERLGAVVLVATAIYVVKVLNSPAAFSFGDELAHWRTADDILRTGHLFERNPLSLTSPVFPGLQIATTAIANVTGLSIYASGVVVIGLARVSMMMAGFLLVERVTGSSRVAAMASFLYMGNPNFMFFTAQYSYESLALPLAIVTIYLGAIRSRTATVDVPIGFGTSVRSQVVTRSRAIDVALALTVLSVVISHHLTAYALALLLAVWSLVTVVLRRRREVAFPAPMLITVFTAVAAVGWLFTGAPITLTYLLPVVQGAIRQVFEVLGGTAPPKRLFAANTSIVTPLWERVIAFMDVGVVSALLAWSLAWFARRQRTWDRYCGNALALTLAAAAVLQFPAQALRLVPGSTEISNRSSEFLYLPIGFVVALGIRYVWIARPRPRLRAASFTIIATIVFMGGVIIALAPWARLPGPYLVTGDTRAIQPESIAATAWLRREFGPDQAVIGDQTNELLMGSYGEENAIHGLSWIYFSSDLGSEELQALSRAGVRFIVVDRRVTTMLPLVGYYYENREPGAKRHTEPIQPSQLEKFDGRKDMTRAFDSGNIVIYVFRQGPA